MEQLKVLACGQNPFDDSTFVQLHKAGLEIVIKETVAEGLKVIERGSFCAIIINFSRNTPRHQWNAADTISIMKKIDPDTPIIIMTDDNTLETERAIRNAGVFYLLVMPVDNNELLGALNAAFLR